MSETLELIDSSFNSENIGKYHLSVQLSSDTIRVCVNESKSGSPIAVWQKTFSISILSSESELKQKLQECPFPVNNNYRSCSFAIQNSFYTYVPSALFVEENCMDYIALNCGEVLDCKYSFNAHQNSGVNVVFAIPNLISNFLSNEFPNAKLWHQSSLLLFSVFKDFKQIEEEQLFIHYQNKRLEVLFFSKGEFKFGNSFSVNSPEDFIYFTLFCCEQLNINPELVKIILLGDIKLGSEFHHLIYSYFQKIQFGSLQNNIKTGLSLNELPKHFFYTLFNQFLCA